MSIATTWGSTPEERALAAPCDEFMPHPHAVLHRAVDVRAPAEVLFSWLCQLRVAPYSYDWIDNFGRRSPRVRTPALEDLTIGDSVMRIFEMASFEKPRQITVRLRGRGSRRMFGDVVMSYVVRSAAEGRTRLLARLLVRYPRGPWGWIMRAFLPWGDLVMMRKQLRTLRDYAEASATADSRQVDAAPSSGRAP